jgi:hypothetical protein
MSIADTLFRIDRIVPLRPGVFRLESDEGVAKEGVFVSPQSMASFPGAAAAVEILAKVTHMLAPSWDQMIVRAFWSLVVGVVLFGISIAETWSTAGLQDKATKSLIAVINTAMLFVTAAGVDAAAAGAPAGSTGQVSGGH